ncbi:restriction endonuclease subunit S [uncultured Aliivibrio sp.]|uniref:restriction endonuclease subunit S n=1 Tax=uncultured Aliivibrio sp. TaxID=873085 RepID=UPI0026022A07|nr:restriction endonuclease subunit S [uncultured Aliivibrio sp.]
MNEFVPEGWKSVKFKDVFNDYKYGPRFSSKDYDDSGNVKTIRGTDVSSVGEIKYQQVPTAKLDRNLVNNNKLCNGDLVMITTADCGVTAVFYEQKIPYIASAYAIRLTPSKDISSEYIKFFMQTFNAKKQVESLVRKGTVANLPGSDVMSLVLKLPPLPEQQKIAAILTSVDEVIEKTQAQINKLKDLKTGMMQELLTRGVGVDGKPHTEFKDSPVGRIPKGWEVVKLSDTGKWKGGGTPSKSNKDYWSGSIPWVSPKDMKLDFISRTKDLITEDAIKGSSTNLITKNSLLMVVRSGILQHTLPVAIAACDLTINQDMKALSVSKGYCVNFIFYYLQAHNHTVLRATLKAGNTVESIDFNEFGKYLIPSPSLEEQVRISDVVASISNKIKVKEYKLSSLKNTKKALMQDLLTGKVRVKIDIE